MAGRKPSDVQLIAVSKTFGTDAITLAINAGILEFGENYVQELIEKRNALIDRNILWHFIGHLQSNKVKYLAEWIHMIHSVDSEGLAVEIEKRAAKAGRTIDILIEVNTSEEATKFGIRPNHAIELVKAVSRFDHLNVKGLMTIGPFTDIVDESRAAFRLLRSIFNEVNNNGIGKHPMEILSMGMSHDYAAAIAEGSTMVRIGTAIFGSRTSQSN
ncbi:MAG: YggS family pyridoxal phosphate-dependent enzyme [Bacteroidetes bacterium]|nr:YggS family pyridoxal phosphate-dependent enzyme [Bacteroidota bacterium]